MRDFPQYAYMWSLREMRVGKQHLRTRNVLLTHYPGADGMKADVAWDLASIVSKEGSGTM